MSGSDPEATLAYGVNLGTMEEFLCQPRTEEYGEKYPSEEWLADHGMDDENEDAPDFDAVLEGAILKASGFSAPEPEFREFGTNSEVSEEWMDWSQAKAVGLREFGVGVAWTGGWSSRGYVLIATASKAEVEWNDVRQVSGTFLLNARSSWIASLKKVLAVLGLTPDQPTPAWLMFAFCGHGE